MSSWLIGPVIIATVIGQFLDQRYGTKPWLFLISLGLAFSLTSFGLVKTVNDTLKELAPTDNKPVMNQDKTKTNQDQPLQNTLHK